jgi:polysaccharide biosynthesis/export protein
LSSGQVSLKFRHRFVLGFLVLALPGLVRPNSSLITVFHTGQTQASPSQAPVKASNDKDDKRPTEKAAKPEVPPESVLSAEQRLTYIIGVEDDLQISVWHEPELSMSVVVRPDGMITLPLINDVKAVGLKTEELQNLLMEKFKNFVNEPQVTVIVRGIRSRKVNLVGEVGHQGTYPINGDMTTLELLAAAGGLGPFAKADSIYILREENGKKIRIPFHYKKAVAGKSENVVLQPGDLVVVP